MDQWDNLINEKMDKAVKETTFQNVFPLIRYYYEVISSSKQLKRNSKDFDLSERLARKLQEKGFPTENEWTHQTILRKSFRAKPPLYDSEWGAIERAVDGHLEAKYAQLNYDEQLGIDIVSQIQFLLSPRKGNNDKYLNLIITHYHQIKSAPYLIQKGQKWIKHEQGYVHTIA